MSLRFLISSDLLNHVDNLKNYKKFSNLDTDNNNPKLRGLLLTLRMYFLGVLSDAFEDPLDREENIRTVIKLTLQDKETVSLTYNTSESYHLKVEKGRDGTVSILIIDLN